MASTTHVTDGSFDFSGGVDSNLVPTIQSALTPNGLQRNQLAWLNNGAVRDGGITTRTGWAKLGRICDAALYQGGFMYIATGGFPYLMLSIAGHILKVDPETMSVVDESLAFGIINPTTEPHGYFVQGEQFLVIQAGDGVTLPLFWDGTTLWRSQGLNVGYGTEPELPAATAMDYYMGRIWYAQGRAYTAGDIVQGPSGTLAYRYYDSIIKVTENPIAVGGDGFVVPTQSGPIRALAHNANLDSALGQGVLFAFTAKTISSLQVPVTRNDWIAADAANQPLQKVVQIANGSVNDRSVVPVNGDLFFQSLEPGIRSLISAVRYFQQWGNTRIDANENRIIQLNDRALLIGSTGIYFNNRLLQSATPIQTEFGIVHQTIVPMDFDPISSFGRQTNPVWEGMYEGLKVLQMFTGNFGGRERAFAVTLSDLNNDIELWEFTTANRFDINDSGEVRTTMIIEFPAYTFGSEKDMKKLVSGELFVDKLFGTVDFKMEYRPDGDVCWKPWVTWRECTARDQQEDRLDNGYPTENFRESYRSSMSLPLPQEQCDSRGNRPSNVGYQFQCRLTVKGWCRIRGLILHAENVDRSMYQNLVCPVSNG